MQVKKRDFEDIFKDRTFEIPRYQRGYDWKKLNRDTFWNDLTYHIDADKTLFLGTIILNDYDLKDQIDHKDASGCFNHAIVDGQQRFTTMTILYVALREALRERKLIEVEENLLRRITRTIEGIAGKFLALEDITYFPIRPRLYGSAYKSKKIINGLAYFTDPFWKGDFPKEAVNIRNKKRKLTMEFNRFKQVYLDFSAKLNEKDENGNFKLDTDYLLRINKALSRAEFIEIVVSNDNDAITLFETVNARGKELETSDLLKNHFFKEVNENKWNTVEKEWDLIVENSEKSGGISRLLKHFYVSRKGSGGSSPPQVLYENLKALGDQSELKLLGKIKEYSNFYKNIATGSQDEFLKQINFDVYGRSLSTNPANRRHIFTSIELLRALNVTQPQPMIFSFFHTFYKLSYDGVSTTDDYNKSYPGIFMRQLEYFHYVNNGIGERRANDVEILYQRTAKEFYECDDIGSFQESLKNFYKELKKERDKRNTFVENFCSKLFYNSGSTIDSMINYSFHIIERDYQKMALFKDIFPNSNSTDVSRDHWAEQKDTRDETYEKIRDLIINDLDSANGESRIHSIGNLLPMSENLNSSLGNLKVKSPYEKGQELKNRPEYPEYQVQKEFIEKYESKFKTWSKSDIKDRAEDLANSIFDIIENTHPNI